MLGNYALSLYRTLSRHRLYALLNTFGLALGIAVCTILFLVVRFETGFDHWAPHQDAIYRVNQTSMWPGQPAHHSSDTPYLLESRLLADFPQIAAAARLIDNSYVGRNGDQQAFERVIFADPTVWDIFPLPFVAGDRAGSLNDSTSAVITQSIAKKYFGTDQAVGRRLTVVIDGQARDYRVSGVLRDRPPDSNLQLDVVVRLVPEILAGRKEFMPSWGSNWIWTFVRLRSPTDAAAIDREMPAFVDREATDMPKPAHDHIHYNLVPLAKLHL